MRKFLRSTLALTVAGALIFPATAGTAHAQSSFVSSSSSNETEAPPAKDLKAVRLENLLKELMTQGGMTVTDEAEAMAKTYLERAMNDELPLFDGVSYDESYDYTDIQVSVFPSEIIDFETALIEERLRMIDQFTPIGGGQFAALVDTDGEKYYTVMVFIYGEF